GGVSLAIRKRAGEGLRLHARKLLPLSHCDVAVTTAGRLPAKYVFHAVTIDLDRNLLPDAKCIETLTRQSLNLAERLNVRTIAFPALGTGTARFPLYEGAQILLQTVCDRLAGQTSLEEVSLLLQPGRGVRESDLAVFYQRAAALAAVGGQSRKLADAVDRLQSSMDDHPDERLKPALRDLLKEVREVALKLRQQPRDVEEIDRLQGGGSAEQAGQHAIDVADDITVGGQAHDSRVERKALQTRLEGLSTLLNVHYGSLNKLEIEKARYAGVGVPIILENQITEVNAEIRRVEELMQATRHKMAKS
uniref:macro domain-containing protein n=1 Tax=Nocardia aurea TaxID=2144174 RepID=UPI0018E56819